MSDYNYKNEIYEALQAADDALYYLHSADDMLRSAGNWGIMDLLGGGMISTFAKHSKMNKAQQELEMAKRAVQNLKRELIDVKQAVDINIETSDFLSFADFFFDGFIADWLMQSRIRDTQRQIADAISKINAVKLSLQRYL